MRSGRSSLFADWWNRSPDYMQVGQSPSGTSAAQLAPAPLRPNQSIAIITYSLISASMLLVNKTVLRSVPLPALVSVLQFAVSSAFVLLLKASGRVEVDGFEWAKVKPYCFYVCLFAGSIYTNMRALELANVETVIVFRSALPLLVSVLEVAFLGRELPSRRSAASLALLTAGAAAYMYTDKEWRAGGQAYGWALAYFCVLSVEMCWGKHIVGPHLGLKSMWGPVLYTNTLSTPLMLGVALATGEPARLAAVPWPTRTVLLVLLSCVLGLAISYFGFVARRAVTATCFTVVGVLNKLLTVVGSVLLSQDHTSAAGILSLTVCVAAAAGYQQAPLRAVPKGDHSPVPCAEADSVEADRRGATGGAFVEMQGRTNRV